MIDLKPEFIKTLNSIARKFPTWQVFADAVRMMALTLRSPLLLEPGEKEECERQFKDIAERYSEERSQMAKLFAIVMQALEESQTDFLGGVMERVGASNLGTDQYLTPTPVSSMMARVLAHPADYKPGQIVTMSDPSCGASVMLIESARKFVDAGGCRSDVLLLADDLDANAFNISFVQLSLLGWAAVVRRMDSLSGKVYEGPWYTPGYFLYCMPMRRLAAGRAA